MLPFKNRLTKRRDIEKVQKYGQFVSLNNLTLKFLENDLGETRIGFVVSLRFSKKAVERNLIKRWLRECFRSELNKIKKGIDIVVSARKRPEEKTKNLKIKENIEEILQKGHVLK